MRKKGIERSFMLIGIVGALLLFVLFGVLMIRNAQGKGDTLSSHLEWVTKQPWPWGCENVGTKDFSEFMSQMQEVYENCKNNNKCGYRGCISMKLDFGLEGRYRIVNGGVLESYGLSDFNNYAVVLLGANIFCEKKDYDWHDYEIDVHYPGKYKLCEFPDPMRLVEGTTIYQVKTSGSACGGPPGIVICSSYGLATPGFAVAHGSQVTVSAIDHRSDIIGSIDLDIKVQGGTYEHLV